MLFGKTSETQLLITSSFASSKQKTPTSFARQSDGLFTRRNLIFVCLILLIFFAFTAHGTVLRRNKAMNKFEAKKTFGNLIYSRDSASESDLASSHDITNTIESFGQAPLFHFLQVSYKLLHSLCQGLSYRKCSEFRQLAKKWLKRKYHQTHPLPTNSVSRTKLSTFDSDIIHTSAKIIADEGLYSQLNATEYSSVKSRRKRLASGDRRLVHLVCKTDFVLEILEDGRVVGNRVKSENGELPIMFVFD